jgi:hypothetical protein
MEGLLNTVMYIAMAILDIIHPPAFYLRHDVSETGFYLRLQVEPTKEGSLGSAGFMNPIGVVSCLETETSSIYWAHLKTKA